MSRMIDAVRTFKRSDRLTYWLAAANVAYASGSLMAGTFRLTVALLIDLTQHAQARLRAAERSRGSYG